MAVDKLVDSTQLDADLTSVANAIRTKGGTSASLAFPADFLTAIAAIPTGGGGSQTYGLIHSLDIDSPVNEVVFSIPESAQLHPLYLVVSLTLSASDWIYCQMNGVGNLYSGKTATLSQSFCFVGFPQITVDNVTIPGTVGGYLGNNNLNRQSAQTTRTTPFDSVKIYAYTSDVTFTGTIDVYGVIT